MTTINFADHPVTITDTIGLNGPQAAVQFNTVVQLQQPEILLQGRDIIAAYPPLADANQADVEPALSAELVRRGWRAVRSFASSLQRIDAPNCPG